MFWGEPKSKSLAESVRSVTYITCSWRGRKNTEITVCLIVGQPFPKHLFGNKCIKYGGISTNCYISMCAMIDQFGGPYFFVWLAEFKCFFLNLDLPLLF